MNSNTKGKIKITIIVQRKYIGKYITTAFSTESSEWLLKYERYKLLVMRIRFKKINIFETKTTVLLGVKPLATLAIIAISAMELIIMVSKAKANKIKI